MSKHNRKSVQEMNKYERKHYSLEAKTFHTSLLGAVVIGLVSLIIGLGMYSYALLGQYVTECFSLAQSTAYNINQSLDINALAGEVMRIYRSQPDYDWNVNATEEYKEQFASISERDDYITARKLLYDFLKVGNVSDIYIAIYDSETSAIIYVVDPDESEDFACDPGYWEPMDPAEIDKFNGWDGSGRLYDLSIVKKYGWICTAGVPLAVIDEHSTCFILADITLTEVVRGARNFFIVYTLSLLIVVNICGVLLTRKMKKDLVLPINDITDAAMSYVKDKREGADVTDHFSELNIKSGDEIENLWLTMSDMERDLTEYEADLTRVTAEKERIGAELGMATAIQASQLPHTFPPFPERGEFDIYASMTPAKEVGGDFYDFFLVDDDHIALVMADVSGKGVPAALFMMISKILIRNRIQYGDTPGEALSNVNNQLLEGNEAEMFVTVWLAVLEISTGRGIAANAGHEHPALRRADGEYELVTYRHSPAVATIEGLKFREHEFELTSGDSLFVYTDGVAEATNASNELFGADRMLEALNIAPDAEPDIILSNVMDGINNFVDGAEQFDDITMLCFRYNGC